MTMRPDSTAALQDIVRAGGSFCVRGGGTKSPATADRQVIDLGCFSAMMDYAPDECVFTAQAATPLRDIAELLQAHGQYLPFDPPLVEEGATIGGTVASGVSGPRRYRYGGVRDFLIGVRVVDGAGRQIRSGGKVVKNAAGFLLHHGMVGSCGRFGILTEVTCKVFPAPEARQTIGAACGSVDEAFRLARLVEAQRFDCEAIDFDETGTLLVTLAGRESALAERVSRLASVLGPTSVPHPTSDPSPTSDPNSTSDPNPDLRPRPWGRRSGWGSEVVKVAGLMPQWPRLAAHVTAADFICAGAVAWLRTDDLPGLARALDEAALVGQVIRGPSAGQRIGRLVVNDFEERVRRVLDPHDCFCAAPDPRH